MRKTSLAVVALSGIVLAALSLSCGSQTQGGPPSSPEDGAASGDGPGADTSKGAPEQGGDARVPEPPGEPIPEATTPVGNWGIAIAVPPGARSEHEAPAERHSVYLSDLVVVKLFKVNLAAPTSLAEAAKGWDQERGLRKLGEGVTPNGAFYGIRTFEARVGVSSMEGQAQHTWKPVSRVYAVLPLGPDSRVMCTGYVEKGAESAADPDIQAVRKICLSMRKL
jgi:hypothetical protein